MSGVSYMPDTTTILPAMSLNTIDRLSLSGRLFIVVTEAFDAVGQMSESKPYTLAVMIK